MVIARGSAFECVAILEYLLEIKGLTQEVFMETGKIEGISIK